MKKLVYLLFMSLILINTAACGTTTQPEENVIPEKYQDAFNSLYQITDGWDLSLEQIVALEPDFMMFWNGSPDYTYEFLSANNISTYTMTSDIDGAKIESVYDDFANMGKIFGAEERAAEIVSEMQAKIDPVKADRRYFSGYSKGKLRRNYRT